MLANLRGHSESGGGVRRRRSGWSAPGFKPVAGLRRQASWREKGGSAARHVVERILIDVLGSERDSAAESGFRLRCNELALAKGKI